MFIIQRQQYDTIYHKKYQQEANNSMSGSTSNFSICMDSEPKAQTDAPLQYSV